MERKSYKTKEEVYDIMNGFLEKEDGVVKDEFLSGSYCDEMYGKMLDAKTRVYDKYGLKMEDRDVESIIDCLLDISRYLALKMYDYGEKFALETINGGYVKNVG